jgi:hypothetical protein
MPVKLVFKKMVYEVALRTTLPSARKPRNLEPLKRGFKHYFQGDFIAALHILVPQFEDILRALLEAADVPYTHLAEGSSHSLLCYKTQL